MPHIRRRVRAFLGDRRVPDNVLDDVLLVTSELLTNAVLHALPPAALHIRCDNQVAVHIEVSDGGPKHTPQAPESEEEHGRGLSIVSALCASHGTFTHHEGATRWARIGF
ncbi:ATP-binding protein [Streptomyces sp. NPDC093094]|uniref:ATP-binding protein n=1 Tax=Streptomyces sp. NPDC093094 TaxID=3366026 RepID=UPI0038220E82